MLKILCLLAWLDLQLHSQSIARLVWLPGISPDSFDTLTHPLKVAVFRHSQAVYKTIKTYLIVNGSIELLNFLAAMAAQFRLHTSVMIFIYSTLLLDQRKKRFSRLEAQHCMPKRQQSKRATPWLSYDKNGFVSYRRVNCQDGPTKRATRDPLQQRAC